MAEVEVETIEETEVMVKQKRFSTGQILSAYFGKTMYRNDDDAPGGIAPVRGGDVIDHVIEHVKCLEFNPAYAFNDVTDYKSAKSLLKVGQQVAAASLEDDFPWLKKIDFPAFPKGTSDTTQLYVLRELLNNVEDEHGTIHEVSQISDTDLWPKFNGSSVANRSDLNPVRSAVAPSQMRRKARLKVV